MKFVTDGQPHSVFVARVREGLLAHDRRGAGGDEHANLQRSGAFIDQFHDRPVFGDAHELAEPQTIRRCRRGDAFKALGTRA
jgi:hypothetical protein